MTVMMEKFEFIPPVTPPGIEENKDSTIEVLPINEPEDFDSVDNEAHNEKQRKPKLIEIKEDGKEVEVVNEDGKEVT